MAAVTKTVMLLLVTSTLMVTYFRLASAGSHHKRHRRRPNLLLVVVDDMGFNDLGLNDPSFFTPTLDKMYKEAFRLNYSYADPIGSSSRASLLSGKFSFKMGLQDGAINKFSDAHVPLNHTILPEALKRHGYKTHLIGKWEQGFCSLDQTPRYRGFDSFFGQYTGKTNPYTLQTEEGFLDYHENEGAVTDRRFRNIYSTDTWSKRTIKEINRHKTKYPNNEHPFFIMTAFTAVQSPNEVPDKFIRKCRKGLFRTVERKQKCAMMASVDQAMYRILRALDKSHQEDNTIVFFTSDNGGDAQQGSSNWPLRGSMGTVWEGGIRVPSFIWSHSGDLLPKRNHTYAGAFHMVDWYPTMVGYARKNGKPTWPKRVLPAMDGKNFWRLFKRGVRKSFRNDFAYLVEEDDKKVAYVRQGDYKMVVDETNFPGWYQPPFTFNATDLQEPTVNYKRRPFLMYNIRKDPHESRDLSKSKVAKNAAAREDLLKLYEDFKAAYVPKVGNVVDSSPANHPEYEGMWSPGSC